MRLSEEEKKVLKDAILAIDNSARIFLFGSRTDDRRQGGDIDILVISKKITLRDRLKIKRSFFDQFGEQKLDLIIEKGNTSSPFVRHIIKGAIPL